MKLLFSFGVLLILNFLQFNGVEAIPIYQELTPIKDHIPVYIRFGDEPLSKINKRLAEAFHEPSFSSIDSQSQSDEDLRTYCADLIDNINPSQQLPIECRSIKDSSSSSESKEFQELGQKSTSNE